MRDGGVRLAAAGLTPCRDHFVVGAVRCALPASTVRSPSPFARNQRPTRLERQRPAIAAAAVAAARQGHRRVLAVGVDQGGTAVDHQLAPDVGQAQRRVDGADAVQRGQGLRVELEARTGQRQHQHRALDQLRAPGGQARLPLALAGLLGLAHAVFRIVAACACVQVRRHGRVDADRTGEQPAQVGVGAELAAPLRVGLVQQQAIGRAAGVAEGTHEAGRVDEPGQGIDGIGAPLFGRGQAQAHAGVLGQAFVDLQRRFLGGGTGEAGAPRLAEGEGVGEALAACSRLVLHERMGQRPPFHLQQVAAVEAVQVAVAGFVAGQAQRRLLAVEHLVQQHHPQQRRFRRQRPQQLRPAGAGPVHGGVGQHGVGGQGAHVRAFAGDQRALGVGLVGDHGAVGRIDDHQRPAQRYAPQRSAVAFAQRLRLRDHLAGRCRIRCGGCRSGQGQRGERPKHPGGARRVPTADHAYAHSNLPFDAAGR